MESVTCEKPISYLWPAEERAEEEAGSMSAVCKHFHIDIYLSLLSNNLPTKKIKREKPNQQRFKA